MLSGAWLRGSIGVGHSNKVHHPGIQGGP